MTVPAQETYRMAKLFDEHGSQCAESRIDTPEWPRLIVVQEGDSQKYFLHWAGCHYDEIPARRVEHSFTFSLET